MELCGVYYSSGPKIEVHDNVHVFPEWFLACHVQVYY